MPKRVDHQQRRTVIANALIRVAAERGLEAVSLRHVAAEAGVSPGMVQHYFRTKDQMMRFALEAVHAGVKSRLAARPAEDEPRGTVRAFLLELLPLDQTRRMEGRVALAFMAYAAVNPDVAAILEADGRQLAEFVADQLRVAWSAGGDRGSALEPDQAAVGLLALVEGLGVRMLAENHPPEPTLRILDAELERLFGIGPPAPGE